MPIIQDVAKKYAHFCMQNSIKSAFKVNLTQSEIRPSAGKKYMLYMHIPFCHTLCPYCSFHKYLYDGSLADAYFTALRTELEIIKARGFDFDEMVVGGGTTLINEPQLIKTLELCKKLFSIQSISCETDPNHIEPAILADFRGLITRLSCGVQSFDDDILRKIARYEKFGSGAILAQKLQKANGILPILSIDLIFNFPNQREETLRNDLKMAKSIAPQQITTYPLMQSNLTKNHIKNALGKADTDNEYAFYRVICEEFRDYAQNNAWSFGIGDCTLNDEYVSTHHQYLGVGSGAFSFIDNALFINAFNLADYCEGIKSRGSANIARVDFTKRDILRYLFLSELFAGNIDTEAFLRANGYDLQKELWAEILGLKLSGAITQRGKTLYCTDFGRYLCVLLMKDFYAGMDIVRAVFREGVKLKNKHGIINIMR